MHLSYRFVPSAGRIVIAASLAIAMLALAFASAASAHKSASTPTTGAAPYPIEGPAHAGKKAPTGVDPSDGLTAEEYLKAEGQMSPVETLGTCYCTFPVYGIYNDAGFWIEHGYDGNVREFAAQIPRCGRINARDGGQADSVHHIGHRDAYLNPSYPNGAWGYFVRSSFSTNNPC